MSPDGQKCPQITSRASWVSAATTLGSHANELSTHSRATRRPPRPFPARTPFHTLPRPYELTPGRPLAWVRVLVDPVLCTDARATRGYQHRPRIVRCVCLEPPPHLTPRATETPRGELTRFTPEVTRPISPRRFSQSCCHVRRRETTIAGATPPSFRCPAPHPQSAPPAPCPPKPLIR